MSNTPGPSGLLDNVRVASPCSVPWYRMKGDDRVRFCPECRLNVYHLSGMTRAEAEATLSKAVGGQLCVRIYRRFDGTILTTDCPVGLAEHAWRAWALTTASAAGAVAFVLALVLFVFRERLGIDGAFRPWPANPLNTSVAAGGCPVSRYPPSDGEDPPDDCGPPPSEP